MTARKKLIEVALPLDAINDASAYDKMPGIGPHPKGLHNWWARLPLPCARAVLFASLVDDPASDPAFQNRPEGVQDAERERLFAIVRQMLQKNAHESPEFFKEAHKEIVRSCEGNLPTVLDPFCGGGSIPLEAQGLGLHTQASDLNPIAVLITKALIEIPPRFRGCLPVNPGDRARIGSKAGWKGAGGLAADIRYYGAWIGDKARERLGDLYPKVKSPEKTGGDIPVIAWLWARTVVCPNPSCGAHMPLVQSLLLSNKKGKKTWIEPIPDRDKKTLRFEVRSGLGEPPSAAKLGRGAKFRCLVCNEPAGEQYIKDQGMAKRMGTQLLAVVGDGGRRRVYVSPTHEQAQVAAAARPAWAPEEELAFDPRNIWCTLYGLSRYRDLFTPRQLAALTTISDLLGNVREVVRTDALRAGLSDDDVPLAEGGTGVNAYVDAVLVYLAMSLDRCADFNNSICRWSPSNEKVMNLFGKQSVPLAWDYAEANTLGSSVGSWRTCSEYVATCLEVIPADQGISGCVRQLDAVSSADGDRLLLVSTDPPYYDNISYADLSDFFYVWLRRSLGAVYPQIFSTVLTPKAAELVASPYRFGSKEKAKSHFEEGFTKGFRHLKEKLDPRFPMTVYYAFRQSGEEDDTPKGDESDAAITLTTGWETMLEALISSGFQISATWPVRASQAWRQTSMGTNALASYIVLACRPRGNDVPLTTRRDFAGALKRELPDALIKLQHSNIAPVDLAQAAIGPGMAIFTRYSRVLESDGSQMRVRTALSLINQALDEVLAEQENEYDPETRWAVVWFDQFAMGEGPYGVAEMLSKAKNTAVERLSEAGFVRARAGKVKLLGREELSGSWDPATVAPLTVWEATQRLIRALEIDGEVGAGKLARKIGYLADTARDLAYRLYASSERRWPVEARAYNALVVAWPEIKRMAQSTGEVNAEQSDYLKKA